MKRFLIALALLVGVSGPAWAQILQPITYYTQALSTVQGASTDQAATIGSAVRLVCTSGCSVAVAASPIDHNGGFNFLYLPANEAVTIKIRPGRYIVHLGTGGGTLHITEMSP